MSVEPAINWQFHKTPGLIDPRARFTRTGAARSVGRTGLIRAVPANTGRWQHHPVTGVCEGLLIEPQRTNLLLRSEELDIAPWSAANLTVTANATTAPDGTTTADTLTATATGGKLAQAVTITAGRGIAFVVFAKAAASGFAAQCQFGRPRFQALPGVSGAPAIARCQFGSQDGMPSRAVADCCMAFQSLDDLARRLPCPAQRNAPALAGWGPDAGCVRQMPEAYRGSPEGAAQSCVPVELASGWAHECPGWPPCASRTDKEEKWQFVDPAPSWPWR